MVLSEYLLKPLRHDDELTLYRAVPRDQDGASSVLLLTSASSHVAPETRGKIKHEFSLREELDAAWAARPLNLSDDRGRPILTLEDPGGEPLDRLIETPIELGQFLRLAVGLLSSVARLHEQGLVHKDIKPSNLLVNSTTGQIWLTGFGIASRLPRERQSPAPPEFIAGTLPYMAPEQTGRMNRSIDSRSDLYAVGVTLYEMLTGSLPFKATDPMEWVHCHIARQPAPPSTCLKSVPNCVSTLIMKLLAKTAEERYQTATGAESDLRRCLAEWEGQRCIAEFPLAEQDTPDRLLIPEKLYGRTREIDCLLASFDRVMASGTPELLLVSGYSGIGKSSVVNELHKLLVPNRGLFASGKFDQYKRDIPYATLAQAFQHIIRLLLGKSETELLPWRDALLEALGPNGQLIADLVPELKFIIGEQPPVVDLPPQDAQRRFQLVFRRFIGVFARSEHPLGLFLDDLQWLDAATLDLLEDLLTQSNVHHLMLIGAYRDNEVASSDLLMRKLEAIRQAGAVVREIVLMPLTAEDLKHLVADSLHCEPERADSLAQLVHEKTAGNPFFAIQFISELADEALLTFHPERSCWSWDLSQIRAKGYTDNVVDLMVGRLNRLPVQTQKALQELACLGDNTAITSICSVREISEEQLHADLWEAVRLELISRLEGSYRFVHDRIQEAAYSLISEDSRPQVHLHIGRLLIAHTPREKREEVIFDVVNHVNRGAALITSQAEREEIAELNLVAGNRAKGSAAYISALKYLDAGIALLTNDCWDRRHDLIFALELRRAECQVLTGDFVTAERRLTELSSLAAGTVELTAIARLRITLCQMAGRSDRAVEVSLEYLRSQGVHWTRQPTRDEVQDEYERMWRRIGKRSVEDLVDLPSMTDPDVRAIHDVLTQTIEPALFTNQNLSVLVLCRSINLNLESGNSDASPIAYVYLGTLLLGPYFGDFQAGLRFAKLGYDVANRQRSNGYQARVYGPYAHIVMTWTHDVEIGRSLLRQAFDAANQVGDLTFAAYCSATLPLSLLAMGDLIEEVKREAQDAIEFAKNAKFGLAVDMITGPARLSRTLLGLTPEFGCFSDEQFDESAFELHLQSSPGAAMPECWYWIAKLQARVFANDYSSAVEAASKALPLLWTSPHEPLVEYHFYTAVARAAQCNMGSTEERASHLLALAAHQKQLQAWADMCPENFASRAALVAAEIARIERRELDAERLYEKAIHSAQTNGLLQNEALATELAASFYSARGFEKIAQTYLRDARYCYLRWGADGKVRQLDELYPHLKVEGRSPANTTIISAPVEHLDLATVIKVSQAVSSEIVQGKMIDALMRTAIEHAGAERGLLIVAQGAEHWVAAEASTSGSAVTVRPREDTLAAAALPRSIVQYVVRTKESVILNDASAQNQFLTDAYISQNHARSILCLPLINQAKLIGVLYLENNLTSYAFTPNRISVLKLLASQAAISLENTRLYSDLEKREAKIRRLVDANVIGIIIWNLEGEIIEANEAFLQLLGYVRDDVISRRMRWTELIPEWSDRLDEALADLKATGTLQPYELEYVRKDGGRVPVLVGGAVFEDGGNEGVSFVLDLTEQKRAAAALLRSEAKVANQLRLVVDTIPTVAWTAGADGAADFFNQRWLDYTGLSPQQAHGWGWTVAVHPDDLEQLASYWRSIIASGEPGEIEARLRRYDGMHRWFLFRATPSFAEDGKVAKWFGTNVDIEDRKKSEGLLKAEKQTMEMIANAAALPDILNDLCAAIDANASGGISTVLLTDPDQKLLWPGAAPNFPAAAWQAIAPCTIAPNRGSCGAAAFLKKRVIISDFLTDPRSADDYHHLAVINGLRASWSEPLVSTDGLVLGTFAIYYPEPRTPSTADLELMEAAANIARIAIERDQSRLALTKAFEEIKTLKDQLYNENVALREDVAQASMFEEIVGSSNALRKVLQQVAKVAPTDSTVLIAGETGTGKELLARAVHNRSVRCTGPFVRVNCAAIPQSLIASELFGHEKGAFTGATQRRIGRFELAHRGTIFLDEVGELPAETQVALLRVLQEREFERVGGNQSISVDVRILAATNRNLEALVETGAFRQDLFYRLNVFPIQLPSLRERAEDIPLLLEYLIDRYAKKAGKEIKHITKKTLELFQGYDWPGNVRELQNVVERAIVLSTGDTFDVDESWLKRETRREPERSCVEKPGLASVLESERKIIEAALSESGGRVAGPRGAAVKLGIPRQTLDSKICSLGIDKKRFQRVP